MESAFLVVSGGCGRRLPQHVEELLADGSPGDLHFAATRHHRWMSQDGRLHVAVWQEDPGGAARYEVDEEGSLAFVVGSLRARGLPWSAQGEWPGLVLEALRSGREAPDSRFEGVFAAGAIDSAGHGFVAADALGFRHVYHAARDGRFVVGSRAGLVARASSFDAARPRRDPWAVAWLGFTGWIAENRTGYEGVRLLPPGAAVRFPGGGLAPCVCAPAQAPWERGAPPTPSSVHEAAEMVVDSARRHLTGLARAFPDAPPVFDLTGGKDSRLLAAIAGGVEHLGRAPFRTVGGEDLDDVRIARLVATELDLDWEPGIVFDTPAERSFEEQFSDFVESTSGSVSAWNMVQRPARRLPFVRVSAANGECLRTHRRVDYPLKSNDSLRSAADRLLAPRRRSLLRAECAAALERESIERLLDDPFALSHPLDKYESYLIRNRARARYGTLDDHAGLATTARILPLYTTEAITAAFALGPQDRQRERLHYEIIRARSSELARIPFAGLGWHPDLLDGPVESPPAELAAEARTTTHSGSFMQQARARRSSEAAEHFRCLFAQSDNPAWEFYDRATVLEMLDDYDTLRLSDRQGLFGVATAVTWLADA